MYRESIANFFKMKKEYEEFSQEHSLEMKRMSESFESHKNNVERFQNEHRQRFDKLYNRHFNLRNR